MAKFCSNCGKKLEEGKSCDCKRNIEIMNNEFVNKGIYIIKSIFVKPIDTIKENATSKNFTFAMVLTGIMSFLAALFMMPLVKSFATVIYGLNEISLYSSFVGTIEIPYFKIFIWTVLFVFALTFVFSGALYLSNTIIFKGKADFKTIYSLYAVCSLIISAALALATIIGFINIYLGLIVLMLAMTLNMAYMIYGIKFIGPKDENTYGYIYLTTITICSVIIIFILKLFS